MLWYLRTTRVNFLWELFTREMASWREPLRGTAFTLTISSPACRQTAAATLPSSTWAKTQTSPANLTCKSAAHMQDLTGKTCSKIRRRCSLTFDFITLFSSWKLVIKLSLLSLSVCIFELKKDLQWAATPRGVFTAFTYNTPAPSAMTPKGKENEEMTNFQVSDDFRHHEAVES